MHKSLIVSVQPYLRGLIRGCFLSLCLPALAGGQVTQNVCKMLLPNMRRNHIPDMALASFAHDEVQTFYCTTGPHPLAPGAIFEAASLSKPVFAAAVLTLVQQGKLDLDRPLANYLSHPYRHQQNPFGPGASDIVTDPRFDRITGRMVLSHTSGLPNWSRHQPLTLLADPGRKWSYSGEGYVYLQRVIETITGEPLQIFVQSAVLNPLHMDHSSFVWKPEFAAIALLPHTADGTAGEPAHYAEALASSTLYTSLEDYAKFVSALLHPPSGSPVAWEETKQVEVNSEIKLDWGLGVAFEDTSKKAYFHWGSNPGFQSFFMVQPSSGRGVLFLTDSDNGLNLVDTVAARFVPGNHPALKFPMLHPKD
jgi:CubicO group peptidase (beta-lactamase class C family)